MFSPSFTKAMVTCAKRDPINLSHALIPKFNGTARLTTPPSPSIPTLHPLPNPQPAHSILRPANFQS